MKIRRLTAGEVWRWTPNGNLHLLRDIISIMVRGASFCYDDGERWTTVCLNENCERRVVFIRDMDVSWERIA